MRTEIRNQPAAESGPPTRSGRSSADTFAVIADVHGNRGALEAVLEDIARRGIARIFNLGDSLYGPLDPAGSARLLRSVGALSIRGNQDIAILEPAADTDASPTLRFVLDSLTREDPDWLRTHRAPGAVLDGRVFLCHGTPDRDDAYLLERVTPGGVELRSPSELAAELRDVMAMVILCAHSHVPRVATTADGRNVVNPGSVGLPAYSDDLPYPHVMESGSPHARYGILALDERGWRVEQVAVPYDVRPAATAARRNGREDWAAWILTGRAAG